MTDKADHARAELMTQWTVAMRQQNLMPVLLLSIDLDDPTNTALMVAEGLDDMLLAYTLHELSERIQREAQGLS